MSTIAKFEVLITKSLSGIKLESDLELSPELDGIDYSVLYCEVRNRLRRLERIFDNGRKAAREEDKTTKKIQLN